MTGLPRSTFAAPHTPSRKSVAATMRTVLYALVPGIILHFVFFGPGILIQIVLASGFALFWEALLLRIRRQDSTRFLMDFSALLTAALFALCIPPLAPWWISAIGMFFAIVVSKHLFGGLGQNVFNPAMVGYVVVLVSFPLHLTRWLPTQALSEAPGFLPSLELVLGYGVATSFDWDGVTQATALDSVKTALHMGQSLLDNGTSAAHGSWGSDGWAWIAMAYALGGIYLLIKRVIDWQVPCAVIGSLLLLTLPGWWMDPTSHASPIHHILSGAVVLGAFFIATDPVSGCTSAQGRLWFGVGIGVLTYTIRRWGGYPDGLAFAVLLMNMAAPLIDQYTQPRVYGH